MLDLGASLIENGSGKITKNNCFELCRKELIELSRLSRPGQVNLQDLVSWCNEWLACQWTFSMISGSMSVHVALAYSSNS